MFGNNPIRKQEPGDGQHLQVHSVFDTIQGEGPFAGEPAVFVRLAGCNLSCYFCDTDFETSAKYYDTYELVDRVVALGLRGESGDKVHSSKLIVITGGEPLRQNIEPFCRALAGNGFRVQIETAGTLWIPELEKLITNGIVTLVCSPKTGKVDKMIERWCKHWKYLISEGCVSDEDGLPNKSTQIKDKELLLYRPDMRRGNTIWLQPCEAYRSVEPQVLNPGTIYVPIVQGVLLDQNLTSHARDEEQTKRNMQLCAKLAMKFGYRVSVQMHKVLGMP